MVMVAVLEPLTALTGPTLAGHPLWHVAGAFLAPLVVALSVRLAQTGRGSGTGWRNTLLRWGRAARSAPLSIKLLAAGSAITAGIHTSICHQHFQENALYGWFFVLLATSQFGWATLILARPTRALLRLGAAANLVTVALWLVSRTSGVPFGPDAWKVESFGVLDIIASVIEVSVAVGAVVVAAHLAQRGRLRSVGARLIRLRALLPEGTALPDGVWQQRHRWITGVLWAHIPAVAIFALARGRSPEVALVVAGGILPFGVLARRLQRWRRPATVTTALGLLTCSAELVYLSGGSIEMHFHYFVMVGLITLYQDWWPFLVAIGYVVLQHGVAGVLDPTAVYNDPAAINHPWTWAGIHGVFVLAMSAVGMASWRLNEALLRNVSEGKVELSEALSLLTATLDATADGIVVITDEGRIASWNQRFIDMWGVPNALLANGARSDLISYVAQLLVDPVPFLEQARQVAPDRDADSHDLLELRDGRYFQRFSTPHRIDGAVRGRVWSIRDVTEQHRLETELSHQAFHDSLTTLANQALFRNRVDHALARASRQKPTLAVLFLDLDGFKRVNDSLGHKVGDDLLVAVAERLQGALRTADTAARLGGDEFAVLLEDLTTEDEAVRTAERLAGTLQRPFRLAGRELVVRASIGIAFSVHGMDSDQLLRNADLAMYSAKRQRKGGYEIYVAGMHATAVERLEMEEELRRGVGRDELVVLYQPIVAAATGRLSAVEALVRWDHPTRGRLAPDSFIGLAEETGLIQEVGRYVLGVACRQARAWQLAHPEAAELGVSVNVSPRQLYHDDIVSEVEEALAASGLAARHLTLELTETAMMEDTSTAMDRLRELKALGVRLAIDDFGTGYSSLSYLERFPVDVLKIDRSFVSSIGTPGGEASLASAIISLARSLHLDAVAEGVETGEQASFLASLGCDFSQGFYFSRPVAAEVVARLLSEPKAELIASHQSA